MQLGLRPRLRTRNSLWDLVHKSRHCSSDQRYQQVEQGKLSEKAEFASWVVEVDIEALPPLPSSPAPSSTGSLSSHNSTHTSFPVAKIKMAPVCPFRSHDNVCVVEEEADR